MSWLSENERRIEGKLDMFELATEEMPRMARVIRELAGAVWAANRHLIKKKDISLECYLSENLSIDGWALLNELDAEDNK